MEAQLDEQLRKLFANPENIELLKEMFVANAKFVITTAEKEKKNYFDSDLGTILKLFATHLRSILLKKNEAEKANFMKELPEFSPIIIEFDDWLELKDNIFMKKKEVPYKPIPVSQLPHNPNITPTKQIPEKTKLHFDVQKQPPPISLQPKEHFKQHQPHKYTEKPIEEKSQRQKFLEKLVELIDYPERRLILASDLSYIMNTKKQNRS